MAADTDVLFHADWWLTPLVLTLTLFEINHQLEKTRVLPIKWMILFLPIFPVESNSDRITCFGEKSDSGYLISQLWPSTFLLLLPSMQVQWTCVAMQYQHRQVLLHHQGRQGGWMSAVSTILLGLLAPSTPHQGVWRGCEIAWTPRATLFPGPCCHGLWGILKSIDLKFSPFCFREV